MDGCKELSIKSCRCRRWVDNCKNSYFRVKNFYGRDHFSDVTFCRSFFDVDAGGGLAIEKIHISELKTPMDEIA